jgi:hypothetical protein
MSSKSSSEPLDEWFVPADGRKCRRLPNAEPHGPLGAGIIRALRTLAGGWQWQAWSHFLASLTTGRTGLAAAAGQELFAYLSDHPMDGVRFDEAMVGLYGGLWPAGVAAWDFSPLSSLADIGGGVGLLLD